MPLEHNAAGALQMCGRAGQPSASPLAMVTSRVWAPLCSSAGWTRQDQEEGAQAMEEALHAFVALHRRLPP